MRLKPSGPSILPGDGSITQKTKKQKQKKKENKKKREHWVQEAGSSDPPPPRLPYIIYQHFKLLEHLIAAKT